MAKLHGGIMDILENISFLQMAVLTRQPVYGQNLFELAEISHTLPRLPEISSPLSVGLPWKLLYERIGH